MRRWIKRDEQRWQQSTKKDTQRNERIKKAKNDKEERSIEAVSACRIVFHK